MTFIAPLAANVALVIAAFGYGTFLRKLFPPNFSSLDRIALTLLGGLGLLANALFLAGQFRFTRLAILLVALPGALMALLPFFFAGISDSKKKHPVGAFLPLTAVAMVLIISFIAGFAEPTGDIRMDTIAYHYLGPRVWVRDARIHPVPDEALTSFPAVVETQYAALMVFGGSRGPQLFSVVSLGTILLVTASLAARLGLDLSGVSWAVALAAAMPILYRGAYGGFVDAIYCSFILAALRIGLEAQRSQHFMLLGFFLGFAMGAKYFGLIAGFIALVCVGLFVFLDPRTPKALSLSHLITAGFMSLLVASPWYLRNWIVLGTPIYPPPSSLAGFFHPKYLSPQALATFHHFFGLVHKGMGTGPLDFLLLPFRLTFHPANFVNGAGGIGVALLALAPVGLVILRPSRAALVLTVFVLIQSAAWFLTGQDPRYNIHAFVIVAIFAVFGWRYASSTLPRPGRILAALAVACSILYGIFFTFSARKDDLHAVFSPSFAEARRRAEIPFVDTIDYINRDPSVASVLVLEPRFPVFYLEKPYLRPIGRFGEQVLPSVADPTQLLSQLPALKISHVIDAHLEGASFHVATNAKDLTLVFQREDQRIYKASPVQTSGE